MGADRGCCCASDREDDVGVVLMVLLMFLWELVVLVQDGKEFD